MYKTFRKCRICEVESELNLDACRSNKWREFHENCKKILYHRIIIVHVQLYGNGASVMHELSQYGVTSYDVLFTEAPYIGNANFTIRFWNLWIAVRILHT